MIVVVVVMMAAMAGLIGAGMWAATRQRRSEIRADDGRPGERQGSEHER